MNYLQPLDSSGVTIVEILVVLAVLGLAFTISTATASRGLTQSRNAQEHSQGLGFLDSQVELLRTAVAAQAKVFQNTTFCMTGMTTFDNNFGAGFDPNASAGDDDFSQYPADCTFTRGGVSYYTSVRYICDASCVAASSTKAYFEFKARWDGVGSLGRQQEYLTYKIQALTPGVSSGIQVSGLAQRLQDGKI